VFRSERLTIYIQHITWSAWVSSTNCSTHVEHCISVLVVLILGSATVGRAEARPSGARTTRIVDYNILKHSKSRRKERRRSWAVGAAPTVCSRREYTATVNYIIIIILTDVIEIAAMGAHVRYYAFIYIRVTSRVSRANRLSIDVCGRSRLRIGPSRRPPCSSAWLMQAWRSPIIHNMHSTPTNRTRLCLMTSPRHYGYRHRHRPTLATAHIWRQHRSPPTATAMAWSTRAQRCLA